MSGDQRSSGRKRVNAKSHETQRAAGAERRHFRLHAHFPRVRLCTAPCVVGADRNSDTGAGKVVKTSSERRT